MIDPVETLKEYLKFPSISTDPEYHEGVTGAHDFVVEQLKKIGFSVESIKTALHPIILASRGDNPDWPHVMLYAHYDVQPADPLELWETPPFEPEVRDGKIYARGACDNKGPFIAQLTALSKVLEEHPNLPLRITFLVEGEEEIGSPSFAKFLEEHKERLAEADCLLISDSCNPSPDQTVITTSLRGLVDLEVEVRGPTSDLHSGLYGGSILNPIQALTQICASLHTPDGHVHVNGFYDDVVAPEKWERDELKKYPMSEAEYQKSLGVPALSPPLGFSALEATRFAPTLEFNGIGGGYQGKGAKTIIPSKAFVKITCRLVANQDPDKIRKLVTQTIEERAPRGVLVQVHQGGGGIPYLVTPPNRSNTPADQSLILKEAFEAAHKSIEEASGKPPLYLREGGSIPIIGEIKRVTGLDSIMIGLANNSDNMHAPNEHFHLSVLERGIEIYSRLFKKLAKL